MEEMRSPRPERHRVMLDVSLFALELLDPLRISEGTSSEFFLEVPGAFVAMIWAARDGESVLSDFIYAYLLKYGGTSCILSPQIKDSKPWSVQLARN